MSLNDVTIKEICLKLEESEQTAIYSSSPLLADLNLGLRADEVKSD
jgi:hypothetical protein